MFRIIPTYIDILKSFLKIYMQGTYLDTILPRADLPENQAAMPEIGQRVRLSRGDILQTTALYQCPGCGKTYQVPRKKENISQHCFHFRKLQQSLALLSTAHSTPQPQARTRHPSRRETGASGGSSPPTARRSSSTSPASTSRPVPTVS